MYFYGIDRYMIFLILPAMLFAMYAQMKVNGAFNEYSTVRTRRGVTGADAWTWLAVAWQAVGNTMFGYAAWGWLLARHPAATVTPMALLVPVFGMGASALLLHEGLPAWKLTAAALVLAGLAVNMLWPKLRARIWAEA